MWPALIRGSVFSSIRNSALIPSDNSSDDILPSLHDNIANHAHIDSTAINTDTKHTSTNNNNNTTTDYNLNNWMKKDTTTLVDTAMDSTSPLPPLTSAYRCEMLSIKELINSNTSQYGAPPSRLPWTSTEPPQLFAADAPGHCFRDQETHTNDTDRSFTLTDSREQEDDTDENDDEYEEDNYYSESDQVLLQMETATNKRNRSTTKERKKQKWKYESSISSTATTLLSLSSADIDDQEQDNDYLLQQQKKKNKTKNSGDRPHACTLCDRRFNRRYNLNAHIRTHDPHRKKLFDCSSCNQSFDRKHDRDRHMDALHYAQKHRYFCDLCDASFSRRDALARHANKRHTVL